MAHLSFALALAVKMAITAGLVVAAAAIAERAGPLLGALVATLPISAGPAYVFVSLDHGLAFVAASALASLVMNAATTLLALTYMCCSRNAADARSGSGRRSACGWPRRCCCARCRGRSAGRWPSTGWWLRSACR
jgi:hypothetical protein